MTREEAEKAIKENGMYEITGFKFERHGAFFFEVITKKNDLKWVVAVMPDGDIMPVPR